MVENFVNVTGGANNDTIKGDAANNTFFGSGGKDTLDGAGGFNTVDYSALNDKITLKVGGSIDKGTNGVDQIGGPGSTQTIQKIVGATGKTNTIDGTGSVAGVNFNVDLSAKNLTVQNIFGPGGNASFAVEKFVNVVGTAGNDTIKGDAANNTFFGSQGNDILNGAGGVNTVDYSALNDKITLKLGGAIDKGANGIDQIGGPGSTQTIQKIVGATGKSNAIDGTGSVGSVRFTVNLTNNTLAVVNLPGIGTANFTVEKFVDVTGTNANDTITGSAVADVLNGGNGNDILSGVNGNDTLVGGNGNDNLSGGNGNDILNGVGSSLGTTDLDTLNGGGDADTFILGNATSKFYIGTGRAALTNFTTNLDKIQLNGAIGDYNFTGNNQIRFGTDLIATLSSGTFNTATDFIFV